VFGATKRRQVFEREALPHLDALYGMALRLTHDERQADDLVQDSLVKAYRFFHKFEEGSNIKAWLFKVLVNTFYNTVRKEKNQHRLELEAEVDSHYDRFLSASTMDGQRAEEVLHEKLVMEKLQAEVEKLPPEFRDAVLLCDLHELSYKEIADILGCPVGTVMSRLYRGRRILQKRLYQYALEQGYLRPPAQEESAASLEAYRQRKSEKGKS
jgi:RNA polymerase sigma-70 factor, ECF subfamily